MNPPLTLPVILWLKPKNFSHGSAYELASSNSRRNLSFFGAAIKR